MVTKKVLTKGSIEVIRNYFGEAGTGMISIKDFETNTYICLYPEEAAFLSEALKELLNFKLTKS